MMAVASSQRLLSLYGCLIPFQPDTKRIWGDHVTVHEHWTVGGEDGSSDVEPLKPVPPGCNSEQVSAVFHE